MTKLKILDNVYEAIMQVIRNFVRDARSTYRVIECPEALSIGRN